MAPSSFNVAVIGNSGSGKTALIRVFQGHPFPTAHSPTVVNEAHGTSCKVDGKNVRFKIWDTNGILGYKGWERINLFIACFSVVNRRDFTQIRLNCKNEPQIVEDDIPVVLVGTKKDLKPYVDDPVTTSEGRAMARQIDAIFFAKCSAVDKKQVRRLFKAATGYVIEEDLPRKVDDGKSCTLL